ncbi:MAG: glycine cleavage system protein R [Nitriliruptorales bacterium]
MAELVVTAVGTDRPGIVAAVAEVLRDTGGNVADSAMTILGGRFAIMLLVETGLDPDGLRDALDRGTGNLGLTVAVTEAARGGAASEPTHVLSVYGADRPGLLAGAGRVLADLDVNITDLSTRVLPPADHPVYAMVLEVALPDALDAAALESALVELGDEIGVDHTLRPLQTETY